MNGDEHRLSGHDGPGVINGSGDFDGGDDGDFDDGC